MIDLLIILMYIVLAAAVAAVAWATVRTMRIVGKTSGMSNGIPVRKINLIVGCSVVVMLVLSFIIGSTAPLTINTHQYIDTFWLRTSNMFVFTGIVAIIAAFAATAFCFWRNLKAAK